MSPPEIAEPIKSRTSTKFAAVPPTGKVPEVHLDLASVAEDALLSATPPGGNATPPAPAPKETLVKTGKAVHKVYGPYRLLERVAVGGMAEVFKAMRSGVEGFEKVVAVKRILPHLSDNKEFVDMFINEAKMVAGLTHPNIVQIFDLGRIDKSYYIAMEYVHGRDLRTILRRTRERNMRLPLDLSVLVVSKVCSALEFAHRKKDSRGRPMLIVHRDVSPQNVLVSREGEVKLADFGIAKAIGRREKSATGIIKGKFAYMSPEQSIGAELDGRSDLFSVGTLLYILTTGRKPFEGEADMDVLMQVRKARFEKPSEVVKDFNPDVERFIARALRGDRARRWQTAEQMADKLDAILVKLGQVSGPAALKRWLDNLATKDGVKTAAEMAGPPESGTIELGSRDLELQDIAPPPAPEAPEPATRADPKRARKASNASEAATRAAPPPAELLQAEVAYGAPTRIARMGRWLKRTTLITLVTITALGIGGYFARPYLPSWLVEPVQAWVRGLPPPIGAGQSEAPKP